MIKFMSDIDRGPDGRRLVDIRSEEGVELRKKFYEALEEEEFLVT